MIFNNNFLFKGGAAAGSVDASNPIDGDGKQIWFYDNNIKNEPYKQNKIYRIWY